MSVASMSRWTKRAYIGYIPKNDLEKNSGSKGLTLSYVIHKGAASSKDGCPDHIIFIVIS